MIDIKELVEFHLEQASACFKLGHREVERAQSLLALVGVQRERTDETEECQHTDTKTIELMAGHKTRLCLECGWQEEVVDDRATT